MKEELYSSIVEKSQIINLQDQVSDSPENGRYSCLPNQLSSPGWVKEESGNLLL